MEKLPGNFDAFQALTELAAGHSLESRSRALRITEQILENSERLGIQIVAMDHPDYPQPLLTLRDPPPFIHYKGVLPRVWANAVAVIGTRDASGDSIAFTNNLVHALSEFDCTIVSGLALGIDAAAHRSALQNRKPTGAILGHGLDTIYPREHQKLADDIVGTAGFLLSELPVGEPVNSFHLVARDRIQSGLVTIVFLVQSSTTGGSMHTAAFAKEQNRQLVVLEPLSDTQDWAANTFLLDPTPTKIVSANLRKFKRYPRPLAISMSRDNIAESIRQILFDRCGGQNGDFSSHLTFVDCEVQQSRDPSPQVEE